MPLFRQLGGKRRTCWRRALLTFRSVEVFFFSLFSLSSSLSRSLSLSPPALSPPLPLLLFPHAASQTALITAPFEAVFQNENEEKAEVTASSRLNFLQLLAECTSARLPCKSAIVQLRVQLVNKSPEPLGGTRVLTDLYLHLGTFYMHLTFFSDCSRLKCF